MRVGGYEADLVAVVAGEVGVDEDEEVGEEGGEGKGGGEEGPGVGVRVEYYGEEGDGGFCVYVCLLAGVGFGEEGRKGGREEGRKGGRDGFTVGGLAVVVRAVELVHFD